MGQQDAKFPLPLLLRRGPSAKAHPSVTLATCGRGDVPSRSGARSGGNGDSRAGNVGDADAGCGLHDFNLWGCGVVGYPLVRGALVGGEWVSDHSFDNIWKKAHAIGQQVSITE